MSFSLAQKFRRDESLVHRYIAAFGVTDEIFGISASQPGKVSAFYNYGAMCVAIPGWVLGTLAGAISGNLLPDFMMSALSVAIYGMFLAIIIPPAKQNKAVLAVVVAAMLISTFQKRDHKSVYQIISVLCSLCMSGSHDISGDPFCHRQCDLGCCGIYCGTDRGI